MHGTIGDVTVKENRDVPRQAMSGRAIGSGRPPKPIERALKRLQANPDAQQISEEELPHDSERVFLRAPRPEAPDAED